MVNSSFFEELHFQPGEEKDQHLTTSDIAEAVVYMMNVREGAVVQEINLQPQKKVIRFD
jgi:NADP-dependent 3-hydroxy acid dehydrogenase YdfG